MSNVKKRTQCGTNQMPRAGSEVWTSGLKRKCLQAAGKAKTILGLAPGEERKSPKEGAQDWEGFQGPDKEENPGV